MTLLSSLPSRKTFITTFDQTYSYIHVPPSPRSAPTLLLLHGFPSHVPDWIYQINHFANLGCGVIVLDLLGYGKSSKLSDPNAYRPKLMSDELVELLDHVKIDRVVGVGHDLGSTLLSRLAVYHPTRLSQCVFLAVGPPKLGTPFNVDAINETTKKQMGCEMLGYIPFISRNADSQVMMERNARSFMSLLFCADENKEWMEHFRPAGAFEKFVSSGNTLDVGEWYPKELQDAHLEAFGRADGCAGVKGWYSMWDQELLAKDEIGHKGSRIEVPSLFIGPEGESAMQVGFLKPNLEVHEVKGGHWVHLERAREVNTLIEDFLSQHANRP